MRNAFVVAASFVICCSIFYIRDCHVPNSGRNDTNKGSPSSPDYHLYNHTIFLPFVEPFSSAEVPLVSITVNATHIDMPIDTGSTGTLIGAPLLPGISNDIGTPAYQFYSSSRLLYTGRLVDLEIEFHGSAGGRNHSFPGSYALATVPVLVVDTSLRCPWYDEQVDTFECPPNPKFPTPTPKKTNNITYMGVGFGRNKMAEKNRNDTPRSNPFLNVGKIDGYFGPYRNGYTVSTKGVHLGLTEQNTKGFVFVNLKTGYTHDEDPRDWAMPDMCFGINRWEDMNCGSALIDTGIPQMYLRTDIGVEIPNVTVHNPSHEELWVKRVKPGTEIMVGFPGTGGKFASEYSFEVGGGEAVEPSFAVPEGQAPPPFINTGRNFLYGHSVAFDADGGRFGPWCSANAMESLLNRHRMNHVLLPHRSTVCCFLLTHVSASGIMPTILGAWKSVCACVEM
ncbi:hypothetical protein P154DRAFT_502253 [Amniculicola lignicola CBS 123094]|uniref:Peptidase A1 domain-containing protein n=1 Tax=Amniculicola lignicola CBS 123094 TaxID=1392246 RepID=A0A6A5W9A1_9PLEO|nr:hypothetical protein P154DRAFT_502253 [Amniculicola lignicola CBS 123094]